MNLTRIEIRNFKSIGSRQAVTLSGGLTVLTGRNGSGKCVAPWTLVEQPWGRTTIESFFQESCSEGFSTHWEEGEYAVPSKEIPLLSYHPFLEGIVEAKISAIFRKTYDGWLIKIETVTGRKIETTPEHRLMVAYGSSVHRWVEASQLSPGVSIMVFENGKTSVETIYRIIKKRWRGKVYDAYVKNVGSYIAGDGIVVHNSNLIDAIRFALGENNPRLLRTDRLSSLVNDNVGKEAEAYVKITIDNSDFMMPSQDKVITVARKMGRDGESTYYLNGRRTPKNIIEDMISSTGLSARGYNIILQGEISRLADKNPVERRKEVEQALGLAQYDEKKAEALNNLQQADNNLRVAQARLQEIDRRMLQLEMERNILLRRRMLEKEVERMQTIINSLEYWRLVKRLNEISRSIDENISLRSRLETELASKQESKKELMEKMEELLRTASLATPDAEKIRLEYELRDYERQLREAGERIKGNMNELSIVKKELSKTRRKRGRMQRKVASLLKDSKNLLKKNSLINIQMLRLLDEKKRLQEVDRRLSTEIANIANRLILVNRDLDRIALDEKNSEKMLSEVLAHYSNLRRRIKSLGRRRGKEAVRRNRMIEKLTDIESVLTERRKILDETMNTVKILMNSLDSFRIVFAKASGIASYRMHSSRIRLLDLVKKASEKKGLNIYGILRESLWFPKDLNVAVESLAGEWLDAILVKNALDMLFLVNFLGEKGVGVKVVTSEGEVVRREIPVELSGRGKHMMNILKYPKNIEKHVLKLFWNSVLANTVEDALVFAKNGFKAVTLHGEVFTSEGGLVREDVEGELEGLRSLVKNFSEKAAELSEILETINNNARPALNRKILEASDLRNKLSEGLKIIDSHMDELGEQLNTLTNEYLDASRRLSQIFRRQEAGKKNSLLKENLKLKSLKLAKEEKVKKIRRRIRQVERELEKLEDKKDLVKNRLAGIDNIITSLNRRMKDYGNFEKTLIEKILKIKEENRRILSQSGILNKRIEELRKGASGLEEVKEEIKEDTRDELVAIIRKIDREIEKLNIEVNRVKDVERRLLVDKEVNESRAQELKNRIPGQPLEVSEDEESSAEHYLNILRSELEKVQEVNMLAISQYEQEVDFYKNALERINELEDERRSIQEFMEDIERRKREAFLDGLNKINNYFSSFFNKMTGGEGWLQLEDPENPFEAGLMVYVRFPGKEARVISGVSGGEKSVAALCLVFAMQKLFPAAFYIFDEPDAHLDYVNVERMTDLLKEVSKESQIIIVSLRDVVVSKADKVIGVYVKSGFSRFIEMPVGKTLEETAIVG
ncbi:MAG: AAA family ATPase [Thermoproteota archaeon]